MEGTQIEALPFYQGFEQVKNEPTDVLPNSLYCPYFYRQAKTHN